MRILWKILVGLLVLVIAAATAGATYQWLAERADLERFPAPGELITVDGATMHLDCRGEGKPVVILEAGLGFASSSWGPVFDAVSRSTQVCAYDRPGLGWSDPVAGWPADSASVVERLHTLLEASGTEGPYVLLGMSAGGVYVREYWQRYPGDVAGMVLVDSSHEQQGDRLPVFEGQQNMESMVAMCSWLQPLGVVRLMGALDTMVDQPALPEESRQRLRASINQSHYCSTILAESRGFEGEIHDARPPRPLGDLPLTVLSQGKPPEGDERIGFTAEQARIQREAWNVLQEELTALSSRGRRLVAEQSGHVIQIEQPQIVIDAVVEMVAALRGEPVRPTVDSFPTQPAVGAVSRPRSSSRDPLPAISMLRSRADWHKSRPTRTGVERRKDA